MTGGGGETQVPVGRLMIGACGAAVVMLPTYLATLATELPCRLTVLMTDTATRFLPPDTVRNVRTRRCASVPHQHVSQACRMTSSRRES